MSTLAYGLSICVFAIAVIAEAMSFVDVSHGLKLSAIWLLTMGVFWEVRRGGS